MHALGDRREYERFDVKGQFWASLNVRDSVVLRNIATGGALVEANVGCGVLAVRIGELYLSDEGPCLTVVVRHTERMDPPDTQRYLVGLEFVNMTAAQRADLDQFLLSWPAPESPD